MSWLVTSGDSSTYSLVLEHLLLKTVDMERKTIRLLENGRNECLHSYRIESDQ
jgi:hypothetical protein